MLRNLSQSAKTQTRLRAALVGFPFSLLIVIGIFTKHNWFPATSGLTTCHGKYLLKKSV